MNTKIWSKGISIFASAAILMLAGCSDAQSNTKQEQEEVSVPVIAAPVISGAINAAYANTAVLEAASESAIAARVSGVVTELYVEEGDYVEAGQPLAQLETEQLALEYKRALANLRKLENELLRKQKLHDKDLLSAEQYEQIKYQFESQKAATELAKLNLDYATIRAPISGIVANRYIKVGNLLTVNQSAFHITDMSELHAVIHVPEAEKASLAVGQTAYILVDGASESYPASVQRVSPIVDRNTGTIRVTVSVKDQTKQLRPGMFSRVSVVYDTHENTVLVPKTAIMTQDDEMSVFVIRDGQAHKVTLEPGFINNRYVEALNGIEVNELVVTTGQRNIKDKAKVEIIEQLASL